MKTSVNLAGPADADRLEALIAAFHQEEGIVSTFEERRAAIAPLLDGSPHGAIYTIGPGRAPVGYVVITFGWSIEFGGLDGFVDEIYIRPTVRGRGIATEVLLTLPQALAQAGMRALHLEVDRDNPSAQKLYAKTGFKPRDRYMLMTRTLG